MMRTNTNQEEDDEDNVESRFGTKSEPKVGKNIFYTTLHYSQTLRKELSLNEWILE